VDTGNRSHIHQLTNQLGSPPHPGAMKAVAVLLLSMMALGSVSAVTFKEVFDKSWASRWVHSGEDKYNGVFELETPINDLEDDYALKVLEASPQVPRLGLGGRDAVRPLLNCCSPTRQPMTSTQSVQVPAKARHYGISTKLPQAIDPSTEPIVLQVCL
jgi:hypothetical protein